MSNIIGAVFIMGAADALLTLAHIRAGVAEEGNPAMAAVLQLGGALAFLAVKFIVTGAACQALWMARQHRMARAAAGVAFVGYVILMGWHLRLVFRWGG